MRRTCGIGRSDVPAPDCLSIYGTGDPELHPAHGCFRAHGGPLGRHSLISYGPSSLDPTFGSELLMARR
jgi:hypothetical protein